MQTTRPQNRREFMNTLVEPYDQLSRVSTDAGNPNQIYTEPKHTGMPEINRAYEVSTKYDEQKNFYVGIKDIDEAVMWYFKNVLKLSVIQNNTRVEVPINYANPESWKYMQKDGFYRDREGKLLAPLLVFKRDTITQNRDLGYKLDGNIAHNVQLFEKGYSSRNFYSTFPLMNKAGKRAEEKVYMVTAIHDYITVQYSCVVWTYFIEQMDKLVEAINYASRSYWGDPGRFQFYSTIDTFNEEIVYNTGEDRAIRNTFNITLNGWLIPDSINKSMSVASRVWGTSQVVFGMEVSDSLQELKNKARVTRKQ
jgi:hypothetical protein